MDKLQGAYSLVLMSPRKLIGARDPRGFRPLSIGKLGNSYLLASETCAFDSLSALNLCVTSALARWSSSTKRGLHSYTEKCGRRDLLLHF